MQPIHLSKLPCHHFYTMSSSGLLQFCSVIERILYITKKFILINIFLLTCSLSTSTNHPCQPSSVRFHLCNKFRSVRCVFYMLIKSSSNDHMYGPVHWPVYVFLFHRHTHRLTVPLLYGLSDGRLCSSSSRSPLSLHRWNAPTIWRRYWWIFAFSYPLIKSNRWRDLFPFKVVE
jgi:hypothetical protein